MMHRQIIEYDVHYENPTHLMTLSASSDEWSFQIYTDDPNVGSDINTFKILKNSNDFWSDSHSLGASPHTTRLRIEIERKKLQTKCKWKYLTCLGLQVML